MIKNLHFFFLPFGVEIVVGFVVSVDCDEIAKTEGFQDLSTAHSILVHFICRKLILLFIQSKFVKELLKTSIRKYCSFFLLIQYLLV